MIEFKKEEFYTTCTGFDSYTDERKDYGTIRQAADELRFFPAPGIAYTADDLRFIELKIDLVSKLVEKIPPKSK